MPLVLQQNELKSNDARCSTLVKTCAAENKLVSGWVKTDFWLDATHGSYVTCCKTSLPWAAQHVQIFFQKVEPLSTFCNNFSQPTTKWFAAGQVWFAGGESATPLFNFFVSMLQNKLHFLVFRFIVPLLPSSHSCRQFSDFFPWWTPSSSRTTWARQVSVLSSEVQEVIFYQDTCFTPAQWNVSKFRLTREQTLVQKKLGQTRRQTLRCFDTVFRTQNFHP